MEQVISQTKDIIEGGRAVLGIELGSTRIKAVLIGEYNELLASGSHDWENQFKDDIWTYAIEDVITGLQDSYRSMAEEVKKKYGIPLKRLGGIGISAMMHGYMAFDKSGRLLVPFRTWRNTITGEASRILTEAFQYNIPQRWTIAHLYQAILNQESHVKDIDFLTTLSGYVHWRLTGNRVLGVGDASGMFPIDTATGQFNKGMIAKFHEIIKKEQYPWKLSDIFPKVLTAGQEAGLLTEDGAKLLDTSGELEAGIPLCPPEGDVGTGMTATNSVAKRTGNVSAGTSIFAMVILEKELLRVYPEIDLVTTPDGSLAAMVHCNNCTSDINAWVKLFGEFSESFGIRADTEKLFTVLFQKALEGDADCGGMLAYNYFSGEHITGFSEGRPLFVRTPESRFSLANFMRLHLYTALGALKTGLNILINQEGVKIEQMIGHGGLFKTPLVGQKIMAAAINAPVTVLETAGEGGAFGIALLASYMCRKGKEESLDSYLKNKVFTGQEGTVVNPEAADIEGFEKFFERYTKGLAIEQAAIDFFS